MSLKDSGSGALAGSRGIGASRSAASAGGFTASGGRGGKSIFGPSVTPSPSKWTIKGPSSSPGYSARQKALARVMANNNKNSKK